MSITHLNNLIKILSDHLGWNKARISFLANMVIALFKVRSVKLTALAAALSGKAKADSKYKQLQRFFRVFEMGINSVSLVISALVPISKENWTLSMDRTNWKLGKANRISLALGSVIKAFAFHLFDFLLIKKGIQTRMSEYRLLNRLSIYLEKPKLT